MNDSFLIIQTISLIYYVSAPQNWSWNKMPQLK